MSADETGFIYIRQLKPITDIRSATEDYIRNYFMLILKPDNNNHYINSHRRNIRDKENEESRNTIVKSGVRLNVNTLAAGGISSNESLELTKRIYIKLRSAIGSDKVVSRDIDGKGKTANRQLTGRVNRIGDNTVISISIVHGETGAVLFSKTVQLKKEQAVAEAIDAITDE